MSAQIVVVGSINADLTVHVERHPSPGETLLGTGGEYDAGGKGANQAVAAALQGGDVAMIARVGSDEAAEAATQHLRSSGVDLSGVSEVDAPTGLAVITVSDDGENSIVVVPGANATLDGAQVAQHDAVIAGADIVLLQGEIPASGIKEAIRLATGRVVINLAPVIEVDHEALLAADPIIANEHEAGLLLELLGAQADSDDPEELITALREAGFSSCVLTLGAQGALVADSSGITPVPTPKVSPVDTTGAGDAFAGALVARLASGSSLIDAAGFAARVAAASTMKSGAQDSYPKGEAGLPSV